MERKGDSTGNPILSSLDTPRRQLILRVLHDRNSPIDVRELATNLAAVELEQELLDVTSEEVDAIQVDLAHVQLSKLTDAGLVDWNRSKGTVTTTNHPALEDPKLHQMLNIDSPGWEKVVRNLASKRRRVILSVLKDQNRELSRTELAKQVVVRERDDVDAKMESADDLLVELYHTHLPKLQEADLISYDTDNGTVSFTGHTALEDEWLDFRQDETPRAILPVAHRPDNIWTLEGRDNVIARGQSLFEQAEDELFLMFTTAGLLEDGCVRRLQKAADRGVDIYLGSQTKAVRDCVREHVPEATIWEPQMDWLNLPPEHEKVSRLVLSDREALMLATLGEETGDGIHYKEMAVTGSGENNPLVILLREMLGSRLDHLDVQSEDFLEQLPL